MSLSIQEEKTLQGISLNQRAEIMSQYLIGVNGRTYNMAELGEIYFGGKNYSQWVSLITRAYNFQGQNSGKYRNGCAFERKYHYRITEQDIYDFVRAYPNGSIDYGVKFENFLLSRVSNNHAAAGRVQKKSVIPNNHAVAGGMQKRTVIPDNNRVQEDFDRQDKAIFLGFAIGFIICKFVLHFGWIASIIIGIIVGGVFMGLSERR